MTCSLPACSFIASKKVAFCRALLHLLWGDAQLKTDADSLRPAQAHMFSPASSPASSSEWGSMLLYILGSNPPSAFASGSHEHPRG